jgi:hypothetical protein
MDFFELRRTAARYGVPFQGVRRSKLLRDLERKITTKEATPAGSTVEVSEEQVSVEISVSETVVAASKPRAAARKSASTASK